MFLIHEGQGRTPLLIHEGPLRGTKNGNGNTFVRGGHGGPRRTATAELQLQLLFVHEGPRRTAKYTSIYPRRILRATKNGNGNTFVRGGHGGPRRTATAELQLQLLFVHEGPRRTAKYTSIYPRRILRATKNGNGNTFVRGGRGGPRRTATAELQLQLLFVHEGPRRTAKYTSFDPRRILRATKNGNGNTFVRGGRGGPRRTATAELQLQLLFVHEGPRRTAKYTSIYPRRILRATKNGNGNTFVRGGRGGPRRTAFVVAADRGRRA